MAECTNWDKESVALRIRGRNAPWTEDFDNEIWRYANRLASATNWSNEVVIDFLQDIVILVRNEYGD